MERVSFFHVRIACLPQTAAAQIQTSLKPQRRRCPARSFCRGKGLLVCRMTSAKFASNQHIRCPLSLTKHDLSITGSSHGRSERGPPSGPARGLRHPLTSADKGIPHMQADSKPPGRPGSAQPHEVKTTVRYLGVEVEHALTLVEATVVVCARATQRGLREHHARMPKPQARLPVHHPYAKREPRRAERPLKAMTAFVEEEVGRQL